MTNGEYRALVAAQPAEAQRWAQRQPGMFEAGVLDAVDGRPLTIYPQDTAAELAAYRAGYAAGAAFDREAQS
jgi:hypothetical protein